MQMMKRVFAITITVLTMTSLLVGCGKTHQEKSSADPASTEDSPSLSAEEGKNEISSEEPTPETESAAG